jgi:hypothetical protein
VNQTSEAAVKPRRNLLTALGFSLLGLLGASELFGQEQKSQAQKAPEPKSEEMKEKEKEKEKKKVKNACQWPTHPPAAPAHELSQILGALCLHPILRTQFFKLTAYGDEAKALLDTYKLKPHRPEVECCLDNMLKYGRYTRHHKDPNKVGDACAQLQNTLQAVGISSCPDWPC